ncbi:LamG-like jellyroll fold domain-containing protein [Actinoplanes solisilvae]|uniref:LamG-like jellyroll fold domain-containing protein n=1 Tax=Actinoplanes solisilvae TaxID=2486853 RepID=UPI000FD7DA37|nr:LamG-like jellyroll fold domain-containing protein [Actinoplanes solisilvae]
MHETSRRGFLAGAGLIGAGVAGAGLGVFTPEPAEAHTRPDMEDLRFTLAVIPDTQYLFDADRGDPAPLAATLRWIQDRQADENIVFTAHLGDIVENAQAAELQAAGEVFKIFDKRRTPYSVLAGNHDINPNTTDQRGPSPYLEVFGPQRFRSLPTYRGATPDGYNTYHVFRAAGREWLVLALDWRPSDATLAWAKQVLKAHPRTPVILTTHDLVDADDAGKAELSGHGQRLWDGLIKDSDQIFLTLNGHFWPPGRTVLANAAGHDVHLHITNYQNRYYGGGAMIRLYHFDLARDTIDVETVSPWILGQDERNELEQREVELTDPANRFSVPIDFTARFAGFAPVAPRPPRGPGAVLTKGTLAYWRFDNPAGGAVPEGVRIQDLSGRGNHLERVTLPGSGPDALRWSAEHDGDQPAHGSVFFDGGKKPARGAYLRTIDGAPLNDATLANGYTIEAFVKLPDDVRGTNHAWMSILSRFGAGADAGKTGDDPAEPIATLSLSDGMALQWAMFPLNRDAMSTNWGHEMTAGEWFHVAVVNDGKHTTLYVDGAELLRNPSTPAKGVATSHEPWFVGAYHYDRIVEQAFYGWLGDLRIVDHALPPSRFMRA